MLTQEKIIEIIIDLVPNWGFSVESDQWFDFSLNNISKRIQSVKKPTLALQSWMKQVDLEFPKMLNQQSSGSVIIDKKLIQERLVAKWLEAKGYNLKWSALFDYNRFLENRTYENAPIGFTFICNPEQKGSFSFFNKKHQKILDVLAETHHTYFRVGQDWRYCDYNFVHLEKIIQPRQYKLIPEFLYPYQCDLTENECGITRTKSGDLIIYSNSGLLAAYRKGLWKIYEIRSLKNSIHRILGNYWLAANLVEILFDLSYKRHGALIIVDSAGRFRDYINNKDSLIDTKDCDLRLALSNRIAGICLGKEDYPTVSKPLVLELASIDGSLVIDNSGKILAYGAMIKSHGNAVEQGARSSAALSAYYHGAIPFKVSSDGEIVSYLQRPDELKSNSPKLSPVKMDFF